jgi:hypothetical protein
MELFTRFDCKSTAAGFHIMQSKTGWALRAFAICVRAIFIRSLIAKTGYDKRKGGP